MPSAPKVTYATLSADDDGLHTELDRAKAAVAGKLGQEQPVFVGGSERRLSATSPSRNPADTRVVVARAGAATIVDVNDAVRAAKAAFPAWRQTPWQARADIVTRAARLIRERRLELAMWCILEMGKNRMEALGEIEETADLFDYYVAQMHANQGYVRPMEALSPADSNTSVLRPYGVWAVVAPWNFPYALLGSPMAAALLAGNTVVAKPASDTPMAGVLLADIFHQAGTPPGTMNMLTGSASAVGAPLVHHPDVAGVTFTGSYAVGFDGIFRSFSQKFPKPCIVEMGGKNPALVMKSADLTKAAAGIHRSAFGMNGHKCSACSRVFVHEDVAEDFTSRLVALADAGKIGDPSRRGIFAGPLATERSLADWERFMEQARSVAKVRSGGTRLSDGDLAHGHFVRPTVLTGVPRNHALLTDELFVPIVCIETVASLDEALGRANDTEFGLTAGVFSRDEGEVATFLDRIEAGVVYVNRASGATTGAWPGVQPFGGWKGSGSTGKNIGGLYTLPTYMREQSRTICADEESAP